MDDAQLVRSAATGDEAAFELLVRRHTDNVWRLARSMLRHDDDAEEATQETFLKAYRGLERFRGTSAVGTWLHSICRRTCLDRLRRASPEVVPLEQIRERRAREQQLDLRAALQGALPYLSPEEREAFTLVDILGYTREEAAGICEVPSSTMRSRVTRARERLAEALGELDEEANGR